MESDPLRPRLPHPGVENLTENLLTFIFSLFFGCGKKSRIYYDENLRLKAGAAASSAWHRCEEVLNRRCA